MNSPELSRRALLRWLGAAGALAAATGARAADSLERVQARGTLTVGIYHDMPPFHVNGRGIDVDLAAALAESIGVKLQLLPFREGENMDDDLRNMVWKGHYLGYGPADVLIHVPVDAPLMEANRQVRIFAPYCRERVMLARRLDRLPHLETLAQLGTQPVAVPGQSLAGWLLLGADGGAYREQTTTHWKDGVEAAQALQRGECAAAAGLASELESVLAGDARFVISPLPTLRAPRDGWAVGLAVKKDSIELATALQRGVDTLATNGRMREIFAAGHLEWHAA